MNDRQTSTPGADPIPVGIKSPRGKLVYLYLAAVDGATANELCAALGVKSLAVYPVLRTLCERGLVTQCGRRYLPADRPQGTNG